MFKIIVATLSLGVAVSSLAAELDLKKEALFLDFRVLNANPALKDFEPYIEGSCLNVNIGGNYNLSPFKNYEPGVIFDEEYDQHREKINIEYEANLKEEISKGSIVPCELPKATQVKLYSSTFEQIIDPYPSSMDPLKSAQEKNIDHLRLLAIGARIFPNNRFTKIILHESVFRYTSNKSIEVLAVFLKDYPERSVSLVFEFFYRDPALWIPVYKDPSTTRDWFSLASNITPLSMPTKGSSDSHNYSNSWSLNQTKALSSVRVRVVYDKDKFGKEDTSVRNEKDEIESFWLLKIFEGFQVPVEFLNQYDASKEYYGRLGYILSSVSGQDKKYDRLIFHFKGKKPEELLKSLTTWWPTVIEFRNDSEGACYKVGEDISENVNKLEI